MDKGSARAHGLLAGGVVLLMPIIASSWVVDRQIAGQFIWLNTALLVPVMALVVVVQQLFVMLGARLLGDRPIHLRIGVGPKLFTRTRGTFTVSLHLLPVLGDSSIVSTRERGQRRRLILAVCIGALGVAAIAAITLAIASPRAMLHSLSTEVTFLGTLFVATLIRLGLWFVWTVSAMGSPGMDGDTPVLRNLRGLAHLLEALEHVNRGAMAEAESSARRGLEASPELDGTKLVHTMSLMQMGVETAIEALCALDIDTIQPPWQSTARNLQAWAIYQHQAVELAHKADESSRLALEEAPNNPGLHDTRGHVLLWLRRFDEAETHLGFAYDKGEARTRGYACAGLALVHEGRGSHGEAVTWLARARELDAPTWLLARATAVIEPLRRE